jgi:adenosylcobinamide-GDP ribazoletransferase
MVSGTVGRRDGALVAGWTLLLLGLLAYPVARSGGDRLPLALGTGVAVAAGLAAASLLLTHCVRRFGGITGDVLGAMVESAATATLLVWVLFAGVTP